MISALLYVNCVTSHTQGKKSKIFYFLLEYKLEEILGQALEN